MKNFYKNMYRTIKKPQIFEAEEQIVISIKGAGNPNNNPLFQKHIEALYTLSYGFRMSYRNEPINGYFTYTVGSLEGFWSTIDKQDYDQNKDKLTYEIFIVQPSFVTRAVFDQYQAKLDFKNEYIKDIQYKLINEGLCGQITHIGPYDTEPESVAILEQFVNEAGYTLFKPSHHEIYISDFRKVDASKLKTLLRYQLVPLHK